MLPYCYCIIIWLKRKFFHLCIAKCQNLFGEMCRTYTCKTKTRSMNKAKFEFKFELSSKCSRFQFTLKIRFFLSFSNRMRVFFFFSFKFAQRILKTLKTLMEENPFYFFFVKIHLIASKQSHPSVANINSVYSRSM